MGCQVLCSEAGGSACFIGPPLVLPGPWHPGFRVPPQLCLDPRQRFTHFGASRLPVNNRRMLSHGLCGASVKNTSDGWLLFFNCCFKISVPSWDVLWCLESRKTPKRVISWCCVPLKARVVPGRNPWDAQAPVPCCVGLPARPRGVDNTGRAAARNYKQKGKEALNNSPRTSVSKMARTYPFRKWTFTFTCSPQRHIIP